MARDKRRQAEESPANPAVEADETMHLFSPEDFLDPALEQLLSEAGGKDNITVYINRLNVETGKEPRVWQGRPDEYNLMDVAKRFGSGEYVIRLYAPSAAGHPKITRTFREHVELPAGEDARLAGVRKGEVHPVAPASQPSAQPQMGVKELVEAITASMAVALAPVLRAITPQQSDPFAQLDKMAGVVQKLMPPAQNNNLGIRDAIALAKDLSELSGGNSGAGEEPGARAMNRGIDLVSRLLDQHLAKQPESPSPARSAHVQQEQQVNATTDAAQNDEDLQMMRLQLRKILRFAANGTSANLLVADVYQQLPDEVLDMIVLDSQWMQMLVKIEPEAQKFGPWLKNLRDGIIDIAIKDGIYIRNADGSLSATNDSSNLGDSDTVDGANGNDSLAGNVSVAGGGS